MGVERIESELAARGSNKVAAMTTLPQGFHMTAVPQWIPVTERLPEPGVPVLCAMPSGAVEVMRKRESAGIWEWLDGDIAYEIAITHWMPLPAPPAE